MMHEEIIATSLLLICWFLATIFSEYRLSINLGIFISIGVFLALLFDLVLLPVLLQVRLIGWSTSDDF